MVTIVRGIRTEKLGDFKDFRTRFNRRAARLNSHGVRIIESAISHRAIQHWSLREWEIPILLATLETLGNPTSAQSLRDLSVKMYETRRGKEGKSELLLGNHAPRNAENPIPTRKK